MSDIFSSQITVKNFIRYVWPSIVMMIIIAFKYNMDSILAANMLGEIQLAALSMAYPIQGLMWGISIMLAAGASAVVAIKMGEGKQEEANEKFTSICVLSAIIGFLYLFLTIALMDPIIDLMGADAELEYHMKDFLNVFIWCFHARFICRRYSSSFWCGADLMRPCRYGNGRGCMGQSSRNVRSADRRLGIFHFQEEEKTRIP